MIAAFDLSVETGLSDVTSVPDVPDLCDVSVWRD